MSQLATTRFSNPALSDRQIYFLKNTIKSSISFPQHRPTAIRSSLEPKDFVNNFDLFPALTETKSRMSQLHMIEKPMTERNSPVSNLPIKEFRSTIFELYPKLNKSKQASNKNIILVQQTRQSDGNVQPKAKYMRHVGFKNSIKIVDIYNGEISKGVISDEKKPVTRISHRKTKTEF